MEIEKILCYGAMGITGILTLLFLLDAALGIPFGRSSILLDVLFIVGGALVLWQGYETTRELA
jgi:hypothetical protein